MNNKRKWLIIAVFSIVIIGFLIITIFLSGNKLSQIDKDIKKLNMETSMNQMHGEILKLVENVDKERVFLETAVTQEEYDAFFEQLVDSYEGIEADYGKWHLQVLDGISQLRNDYDKNNQALKRIEELDLYQVETTRLFTHLMNYHYMIVESKFYLFGFNKTMDDLTRYVSTGNISSIEYNEALTLLMSQYDDLLNTNSLEVFDTDYLNGQEDMKKVLMRLEEVKSSLSTIETVSEVDSVMNTAIYSMFDFVEKSISTVYAYSLQMSKDPIQLENNLRIEHGAKAYYDAYVLKIHNPFLE